MENSRLVGISGWPLAYVIGSIPLLMMYSMGLSGWFFDYPIALMAAIFIALAVPLVLVVLKSPMAPQWNIAQLWIIVVLMALRSISVFLMPSSSAGISSEELPIIVLSLVVIVSIALVWAVVWTRYFTVSQRVRNTFA